MRLALSDVASEASVYSVEAELAKLRVKLHHSSQSRKTSSAHAQHAVAAVGEPSHITLPSVMMQDQNAAAAARP